MEASFVNVDLILDVPPIDGHDTYARYEVGHEG